MTPTAATLLAVCAGGAITAGVLGLAALIATHTAQDRRTRAHARTDDREDSCQTTP